ncbi:hypothetical protein Q4578_18795 [Shimia thalassica]|uniref:hypothetical protein n=1 Tax=Shimia thalassica TaxID=1715693 RepID=UPI0026E3C739|nr:hypothetical protein [Shimia thalassica]MDO6523648.1 hypothetical protein [Shimia thalassica]
MEKVTNLNKNRVLYTPGGSTLIVSFDNAGAPHREPPDRQAWGHKFFVSEGHSVLGIIAKASDWYRDASLHDHLIQLKDTGVFTQFSRVVMTGSSMGGYGATAFSSLAPGCHVLSFNPQSTLNKTLVPWETKHPNGSRQNWEGPFADAAEEIQSADVCYIFYDPFHFEDRLHAERFKGSNIKHLRAPFLGHGLPDAYLSLGVLKDLMRKGIDGTLDTSWHSQAIRERKRLPRYYKSLVPALSKSAKFSWGIDLMKQADQIFKDPYFTIREAVFQAGLGDVSGAVMKLDSLDKRRRKKRKRLTK